MTKKLSQEEIQNFSVEKAWEIAGDFADLLQQEKNGLYFFTDELPWVKPDILLALLKLIREYSDNKDGLEVLCSNIACLEKYIPSPSEYEVLLESKKQINQLADINNHLHD